MLFRDLGGAELGCGRREQILSRIGGRVVNVDASGLFGPISNLGPCSIFISRNVNHEKSEIYTGPKGRGELGLLSGNHKQFRDM